MLCTPVTSASPPPTTARSWWSPVTRLGVIVSADTDFGTLLASERVVAPSVLLLRLRSPRRAAEISELLLANLDAVADELDQGAIVVVEDERIRVRRLPI